MAFKKRGFLTSTSREREKKIPQILLITHLLFHELVGKLANSTMKKNIKAAKTDPDISFMFCLETKLVQHVFQSVNILWTRKLSKWCRDRSSS